MNVAGIAIASTMAIAATVPPIATEVRHRGNAKSTQSLWCDVWTTIQMTVQRRYVSRGLDCVRPRQRQTACLVPMGNLVREMIAARVGSVREKRFVQKTRVASSRSMALAIANVPPGTQETVARRRSSCRPVMQTRSPASATCCKSVMPMDKAREGLFSKPSIAVPICWTMAERRPEAV